MQTRLKHLALCAAALSFPLLCHADVYLFTGLIDSNHTGLAITSFRGQFSFDANAVDGAPLDANNGVYPMGNALYGMQVSFDDGTTFAVDPLSGYFLGVHVPVATPVGQPSDVGRFTVDGDVSGTNDRFLTLRFEKAFITDALPTKPGGLTLSSFDKSLFSYVGLPGLAPPPGQPPLPLFGAFGHLTSLQCQGVCAVQTVPEPGAALLVMTGLGALWLGKLTRKS